MLFAACTAPLLYLIQIRDLEARVELLSASQDEALTDCRAILRGAL